MGWRHVVAGCTIVTLPVIRNGHMSPRSSINQLQTISCDNKLWKSWISFNANHAMGQFEQFCWCHCHQQGSDFAHINCIHCFWWETIYSCLDVQLFANIVDILWHCTGTGELNGDSVRNGSIQVAAWRHAPCAAVHPHEAPSTHASFKCA